MSVRPLWEVRVGAPDSTGYWRNCCAIADVRRMPLECMPGAGCSRRLPAPCSASRGELLLFCLHVIHSRTWEEYHCITHVCSPRLPPCVAFAASVLPPPPGELHQARGGIVVLTRHRQVMRSSSLIPATLQTVGMDGTDRAITHRRPPHIASSSLCCSSRHSPCLSLCPHAGIAVCTFRRPASRSWN